MRTLTSPRPARPRLAAAAAALLATASVTAAGVATAAPASAASVGGSWQMDEASGPLRDSLGSNDSNPLPTGVSRTALIGGGRGLAFDGRGVVTVPDAPSLRPGNRNIALEVRVRPNRTDDVNVLQKGQFSASGHMIKLEVVGGSWNCIFKGAGGDHRIGNATGIKGTARAGAWQTVRCLRQGNDISLVVNGVVKGRRTVGPNFISTQSKPVQIGGKVVCPYHCDRLTGQVDYARVLIG